jgi:hypothetical protein
VTGVQTCALPIWVKCVPSTMIMGVGCGKS